MAHNFKVDILTPTKTAYSGMVSEAVIPGADGEVGILPGHRDLIGLLGTGTLRLQSVEGAKIFMVSSGFYEVKNQDLSVLCEVAEPSDQIDTTVAADRARELKIRLEHTSGYAPEFEELRRSLAVEESRIKTARK